MEEEENEGWRMGTENNKPKIRIRMKTTDSSEAPAFLGKVLWPVVSGAL